MNAVNLTKTLKGYNVGWVSISQDQKKVIASARSLKGLLGKLKRMNNPKGYIMKAAKDYSHYVGS